MLGINYEECPRTTLKPMNRVVKESGRVPGLGNSEGHELKPEAIKFGETNCWLVKGLHFGERAIFKKMVGLDKCFE